MKITVELPDDVAQRPDPGREALEALVRCPPFGAGVLITKGMVKPDGPRPLSKPMAAMR
jgi:hypothetical protein